MKNNSAIEQDKAMSLRGVKLESLYGGYFGSLENCQYILPHLPDYLFAIANPIIVDAGSSQGFLGDYSRSVFKEHGCEPRLIMIDTNENVLGNSPVKAEKLIGNLLNVPLEDKSAHVVLLRSVLHYVPLLEQTRILKEIHRVLVDGGVLISQFASFSFISQASVFSQIFDFFGRDVYFLSTMQSIRQHHEVFPKWYYWRITEGPTLFESILEFAHRVGAKDSEIEQAHEHIAASLSELDGVLIRKQPPYAWRIPYKIVSCRKS